MDQNMLIDEIRTGDYLSGDHMNMFADILRMITQFSPQNVFYVGALHFVQPIPIGCKHIQLLSNHLTELDHITHWICIFYDGMQINVYDSLNLSTLSDNQYAFLHRMLPHQPPIVFRRVQRQPNYIDCGVFALAFATSLAIGIDPAGEEFHHPEMRMHLASIFETKILLRFPSIRRGNVCTENRHQRDQTFARHTKDDLPQNINRYANDSNPMRQNSSSKKKTNPGTTRTKIPKKPEGRRHVPHKASSQTPNNSPETRSPFQAENSPRKRKYHQQNTDEPRVSKRLKEKNSKTHKETRTSPPKTNTTPKTPPPKPNTTPKTSPPKPNTTPKTSPPTPNTTPKTSPPKPKTRPKTPLPKPNTTPKTSPPKPNTTPKTSPPQPNTRPKTPPPKPNTTPKTSPPKPNTMPKTSPSKTKTRPKISPSKPNTDPKTSPPGNKRGRPPKVNRRRNKSRPNNTNANNEDLVQISDHEIIVEDDIEEHYCGPLNITCSFCAALHFRDEQPSDGKFSSCCQKGKVDLRPLDSYPYPRFMEESLTGLHDQSKNFRNNIRSFNSALSFASMGAQIKPPSGSGPYCFRIHGQIYHRASTLHPPPNQKRQFAQLYILDPQEATEQRMAILANQDCDEDLMNSLGNFFRDNNPLAQAYRMLYEVELENNNQENNVPETQIKLAIIYDSNTDKRRYNAPRGNEVAVVFQGADGEPPYERDLLIHLRPDPSNIIGSHTQRISILHPKLEPMTYPLLFPFGNSGWSPDIPLLVPNGTGTSRRERVTQLAYFSYRLSVRLGGFNPFLSSGKLTQQYIVDSYVKMEANRIKWIKDHEKELHAESYEGLMDHLHLVAAEKGMNVGRPIILPSTFIGSPRNMQKNYQDAMAIVRKKGKPDFFVTVTCNPKWREITENLPPYQKPEDRPDLIARVFDIKLKSILEDIQKNHIFGKVTAKIHVIEFQKRGLPHAHMLIILANEDKPRDKDIRDKFVSAEIPDNLSNPRLHDIILKHNIHGPCGKENPNSPCMQNGSCSKNFPKAFQTETASNVNGYPLYQRRDDKRKFLCRSALVDNSWVVPYNPYLSLKYNCHINVEICASVKSVKYLFKYVYKGHDCASLEITETPTNNTLKHDETKMFLDTRYISAPEATWRLFGKSLHDQSHTVVKLAVHLEKQQTVYFDPDDSPKNIERNAFKNSTLMAWFDLNKQNETARRYHYVEMPEHFVFSPKTGWSPRKKGGHNVIGRMYTVSIAERERYFLRLLLLHTTGATCFEDLRTFEEITYNSFRDCAKAKGLLLDDNVWDNSLLEAVTLKMPRALREMFALICVFGDPLEPLQLWTKYCDSLIEDFAFKHGHQSDTGICDLCENLALRDVQNVLCLHGKNCTDFGLRNPPTNLPADPLDLINIVEEQMLGEKLISTLNAEQKIVFNEVLEAIYNPTSTQKCFFVNGPGGTGKTHLYNTLMSVIRGKGDIVLPVASTGIAANLLKKGRTYHSQFKLPIPLNDTSTSTLKLNSVDSNLIRQAKLIILDEATMAPSYALKAIDKLLRKIMDNDKIFGDKVILLGGDFQQCLPIVRHANRSAIIQSSIKYFSHWNKFKIFILTVNQRCVDKEYNDWLLSIGKGIPATNYGLEQDIVQIPKHLVTDDPIVEATFGSSLDPQKVSIFASTAILCPTNDVVNKINEEVLSILRGESHTFYSIDTIDADDEERLNYPVEFLNSLTPSGMPPHKLNLKTGAIVMLLRNLNTKRGLCNGTRLAVTKLCKNVISVEILTGSAKDTVAFIPRIELAPADPDLPFVLRRRQFRMKLAFCMTINKSQGQTLDKVGLYLEKPVFSHGQLYVALSRVRRSSDIKVKIIPEQHQGNILDGSDEIFTKNIVYKEIFNT